MPGHTVWWILVKVNDLVYKVLTVFCAVFLAAMLVTVFYQVLGRFVLQASTPWAEETAVFSFIWMVLFGSALGVRDHSHLVADLLPESMGPFIDKLIPTITYAVTFTLALAFVIYGGEYALLGRTRVSETMGFRMIFVYVSLPISGVAMILFLIERTIITWTGLELPGSQSSGAVDEIEHP
ncbi:MAG: TRAP transporter small permease [Rhodospirillales bacterium]|nr:TRAP transporter small permease [Rhodospirillales bacterium]